MILVYGFIAWLGMTVLWSSVLGEKNSGIAGLLGLMSVIALTIYLGMKEADKLKNTKMSSVQSKEALKKDGFKLSFMYESSDFKSSLYIDATKKIIFLNMWDEASQNRKRTQVQTNDILSIELNENGKRLFQMNSDISGTLASAAIGGIIFGGAGAVVGAIANQKNTIINRIEMSLQTKNLDTPYITFNFLGKTPVKAGSQEHEKILRSAQEWVARINVLLAQQ